MRKSTVSEPSRSTASATTVVSTESSLAPLLTRWPASRALAASSRPCFAIHRLCHASIATATERMEALRISCPMPSASDAIASAPNATTHEPASPSAIPPARTRFRRSMPRVAAATMPTMRAASRNLAKDDERSAEHLGPHFATITPLAVFSLNSPTNGYSPALRGPT